MRSTAMRAAAMPCAATRRAPPSLERRRTAPRSCRERRGRRAAPRRALLPQRAHVGEAHAVRRQHAGERMDEHARHAERVGDEARVLAAGAAEAAQRVLGDVVAALHRDVLDRVRHVLDGDLEEAVGDLLGRRALRRSRARSRAASARELARARRRRRAAASPSAPNTVRKERRVELADHHVAVGHRQRTAAPIRRRARDSRPPTPGRRESARRRTCRSSRRPPRPCGCCIIGARSRTPATSVIERALVLAGVVRDVGRRAAHVEADDPVEAGEPRHLDRADDAAGRARTGSRPCPGTGARR